MGTNGTRYSQRKSQGRQPASIEFDTKTYAKLQRQAAREQRSIAAIVRIAVDKYLTDAAAAKT